MSAKLEQPRKTVLITGASGGIGLELAEIFARNHRDLMLVARREVELESIAERLSSQYGVRVEVFPCDLSEEGAADRAIGETERRGTVVDVLINNAGYAQYGPFVENEAEAEMRMLQLNMVALTRLTKLVLPGMIARRYGRIMNVASTAAFMPGPLMAVYYASKAYVLSFSEALNEELRGMGVTITALCPGPTATGFQERAQLHRSRLLKLNRPMDSATVAHAGYDGLMRGKPLVIPGRMNKLQAFTPRLMPRRWVPFLVRQVQAAVGR